MVLVLSMGCPATKFALESITLGTFVVFLAWSIKITLDGLNAADGAGLAPRTSGVSHSYCGAHAI